MVLFPLSLIAAFVKYRITECGDEEFGRVDERPQQNIVARF